MHLLGQNQPMTLPSERRFAGVLAYYDGEVILVREAHASWGGAFWNVPSGMVAAHETPAEGAARELMEETGLRVQAGDLRLRTTSSVTVDGSLVEAWNFEVDVDEPTVRVDDPDQLVQEARWFSVEAAIGLLRTLPYRPLAEPAVAVLSGTATGLTSWTFERPDADPDVTTSSGGEDE
jgi:8-oxo-dGTP diphosphatase